MTISSLLRDRPVWTLRQVATAATAEHAACLSVVGVRGAAVGLVVQALLGASDRPLVVVTPDAEAARGLEGDLGYWSPHVVPCRLDAGEQSPWAEAAPDRRAAERRLSGLHVLSGDRPPPITILPAPALLRRVVPAAQVRRHTMRLSVGDEVDRDELVRTLTHAGYLRVPMVEDPSSVAVRGALLDVWPPGLARPVRIELDFDQIASLKEFDPGDQRSLGARASVDLPPAREALVGPEQRDAVRRRLRDLCDAVDMPSSRARALVDDLLEGRTFLGADGFLPAFVALEPLVTQLPPDALVLVSDPHAVTGALEEEYAAAEATVQTREGQPHYPLDAFYIAPDAVDRWLNDHPRVALMGTPVLGADDGILSALGEIDDHTPSLATEDLTDLRRTLESARGDGSGAGLEPLLERIAHWEDEGYRVAVTARTTTQAERLATMLRHRGLDLTLEFDGPASALTASMGTPEPHPRGRPDDGDDEDDGDDDDDEATKGATVERRRPPLTISVGALSSGVVAPAERLVVVTEEDIFGARTHRRRKAQRGAGKRRTKQLLEDLRTLAVGDHVVHVDHGVGRYEGLIHRAVGGHTVDLLVVSYAGGDKLYLPVYRLNQVHRFRADGGGSPKLDRLGGQTFARTKSRAKKKVRDLADQLLKLYAERENAQGFALAPVDDDYRAFEAAFPYEETDDQARAIDEVGADLETARPMDRLVCGDVGFGKTEVALRAAFRMAMAGRQVAVLCPTTVLAQQHARTFRARFGAFPIEVAAMSRFQSKRDLTQTVRGLREGAIDVVVGTHRLLSKDVHFKRLGLLVVDEEQRFGVAAKERIKALRTHVDVLTLSATPIPRTMQMAITGLRDLSTITTPPADRRAVRTVITRHDPAVLGEAIERELSRGGQVFFVYNRIDGLAERAAKLQQLAPTARIAFAHGRMRESVLEKTMLGFVEGEFDILCTTAIVENGLDIPRANTILVDRADLLGLSQLYQLRGRVGRSKERGYCYLVLPPGGSVTEEARTRLEALQRYSDLGSGFQLASLDLDLRGGGDLLGAEQSGAIASVGVEMFASMLASASAELRGEPADDDLDPELSFDVEALLPESYVEDVGVRLSLYKRLAGAMTHDELSVLADEMEDRFGRPPPEARRFVQLMTLKVELRRLRVLACEASQKAVTLHLRDDTPLEPSRVMALVARGTIPLKLTPDMRLTRRARAGERFASGIEATQQLLRDLAPAMNHPDAAAPATGKVSATGKASTTAAAPGTTTRPPASRATAPERRAPSR
ncbi:MAG: transcription-repair coupling factor [Myxococcota bacterium]